MHRRGCLALGLLGAALAATLIREPRPLLVWNSSASAPVGLYWIAPGARPTRGDYALAWAPEPARALAAQRHYLPRNVPLVKRVAAVAGERICARGAVIAVQGRPVAERRHSDALGRALPAWRGCHRLGDGETLLLMPHRDSFDGRYFGVTRRAELIGKAVPLWVR